MKTEEINDDTKVMKEEINGRKRVAGTNDMTQEGWKIRHVGEATEGGNGGAKRPKNKKKMPRVKISGMDIIGFSWDFSIIRVTSLQVVRTHGSLG